MDASLLNVVTCIFNPIRFKRRIELYHQFEQHMLESGVKLTTVECQLGDRPFELHNPHVNHVKVRTATVLWNKENLLNLGIQSLGGSWKYLAWIDADIMFRNKSWASETVHALQQYKIMQPWAWAYDLGPHGEHIAVWNSFCQQFVTGKPMSATARTDYTYAHSGYAWACTRQTYEGVGGLLETAAGGAGDHHMAWALINHVDWSIDQRMTEGYKRPCHVWENHANTNIHQSIGYLRDSTIEHFFHGKKEDRGYRTRWNILASNHFDPDTDIKKNAYGVQELSGNKPNLARELDLYLRARNDDGNLI